MDEAMTKDHKTECYVIRCMINAIAKMCAADPEKIIDLLKEHLWTDAEVQEIKGLNV